MCHYGRMGYIRLESVKVNANKYRGYLVFWAPSLWDTWNVLCEWGRIGEQWPRGVRLRKCADLDEALRLAAEVIELRRRHGYVVKCVPKNHNVAKK